MQPYIPYIEYAINKEYIIEFLCINREEPELNCQGKCHLQKNIKESNNQDLPGQDIPRPNIKLSQKIPGLLSIPLFTDNSFSKEQRLNLSSYFIIGEFKADIPTPPPKSSV